MPERRLQMKKKEEKRVKIFGFVKADQITLKEASSRLDISYRQTLRLYAAYKENGNEGLIHGNCGKIPKNQLSEEFKEKVLEIYREYYYDFGPTFAAEKLSESHDIHISVSSLRKLLIKAKLWENKQQRIKIHRSRRARREHFGELIQFDGSHHNWFGEIRCCLITMIDDATNIRISRFFEEETIAGAMTVFYLWIKSKGIPEALYCDKKNAFVLTREPTDAELLAGITEPKSHFGNACEKLGVYVISANSPQAKGRVERNHRIDQDRLVKELRLAGITDIDAANRFLEDIYLPKMNEKFSLPPAKKEDAHVPLGDVDLSEILCYEYDRKIGNDYVVRFENRLFQILKSNNILPRTRDKVVVRVKLDGTVSIIWESVEFFV